MLDPKKDKAATPLVEPQGEANGRREAPQVVDIEAPRSTDENGDDVPLPDLGGKID